MILSESAPVSIVSNKGSIGLLSGLTIDLIFFWSFETGDTCFKHHVRIRED